MGHVPVGRTSEPVPEIFRVCTRAPEATPPEVVAFPMPSQVTAPGTLMFRVGIVTLPAEKTAKLPLVNGTVEAVKVFEAQKDEVVSHVPSVAADAPLLSQNWLYCALA